MVIDHGAHDREGRTVTLREVDDDNWRSVADVVPRDDQRDAVPPSAARYLLLSSREPIWTSLAVLADDRVVGHVMWARDDEDGRYWIGGLLIDAGEQGSGIGRAATETLVAWLRTRPDCTAIRLSYQPSNLPARRLYTSLGFVELDEREDDEVVAELTARPPA